MSDEKTLEEFMFPERLARLDSVLAQRTSSLTVVLDGVHNYHNISAVIRSADAFGLRTVHLIGKEFEFSKGITLGTEQWMDIQVHESASAALERLHSEGFRLVVTAPEDDLRGEQVPSVQSVPVYNLPFHEKLAVVFGNEKRGVSPELFSAASIHAFIPMVGFVESLNISVACAITLFASMTSGATAERKVQPLSSQERQALRATWLRQGLRNGHAILKEIGRRAEQKMQKG